MEVEMKAKITIQQANDLIESILLKGTGWHISRGGGWHAIYKKDSYFQHKDKKRPHKHMIRVRSEGDVAITESFNNIITGNIYTGLDPNERVYLTSKVKNVDENGVENNEEYEGELIGSAATAFDKAMQEADMDMYFEKMKVAVSFYCMDEDNHEIHCEIVNVNGHGPYLEIEAFVNEFGSDCTDYSTSKEAETVIKDFFNKLHITEFDNRSWKEIIN